MIDEYITINGTGEGFYSEKRSKFFAFAHHVSTRDEVKNLHQFYKEKYYDARHVCYAYLLGPEQDDSRMVDDGEPSSTAGKPILGQILSHQLTDVVVFVIRYFGGVKLGTSGLIRAYRTAADDALNHTDAVTRYVEEVIDWQFTYPMMNAVMHLVKEMNLKIISRNFDTNCSIRLSVRKGDAEEVRRRLSNLSFE
ncbi:MAG: YigZ family protein [Prevotella sp.]|jgi:uncharacterized YigZ family protein|nr:YigZ family protein [Prevotella sp.]MCH3993607.1 YigZ family protein [Prevotella sp.]